MTYTVNDGQLAQIDELAAEFGFATRSEFIREAALSYGTTRDSDIVLRNLSQITFYLHQIKRAEAGQLNLLKKGDIAAIMPLIDQAMRSIITEGQRG